MKAMILHDEKGHILSVVVIASEAQLELLPDRGESVLEVDASELGLGDVQDLTSQHLEQIHASIARTKASMRVDRLTRRLVTS